MNPKKTPPPGDANEEISALIETLHETEQRLEELTAGEVDTVAGRAGRTILLQRAQNHLRHNEAAKQAAILNALPAHIALLDTQGRIISVNEAWRQFAGANTIQAPGHGIGLNYLEICDSARGDDAAEAHQVAEGIRSVLAGGVKGFSIEYACHSPTEQRWFLLTVTPMADDPPHGAIVMHLNITERKIADVKIRRQTQLFAALSQCNQAIARCVSEEELFTQICCTAVQLGGMKMAWVGITDTETLMVRPVASFGAGTEDLQDIEISTNADTLFGRGPVGTAIREKQPFWCQDFLNDPVTVPWHDRAAHAGLAAVASLPLHRKGVVVGAFTLYSGEANSFDELARDLLVQMASDISFALDNFARESQRRKAEASLRESEELFRGVVEQSIAGIYIIQDGKFAYVNPHFAEMRGFGSADEMIGRDPMPLIAEQDRGTVTENNRRLLSGETRSISYSFTALRKDGSLVQGHAQASYNVLKGVEFPWPVAQVALQHHERMDGSGYPQGLKGQAILLEARIMAVADVVEAMSSHRPYRSGLGIEKALAEIERGRESAYDPVVADACLKLFREKGYTIPA